MEVAVAEEKKKIFRARKTMKISDRQQLETLHSTLLTGTPPSSNSSSPPLAPLLNGTHREDGHKRSDKEQSDTSDSKSPHAASPVSLASGGSPPPSLSLNLSPSPPSSKSPRIKEDTPPSPVSPFHSLNFELKKMEEEAAATPTKTPTTPATTSPTAANDSSGTSSAVAKEGQEKVTQEVTADGAKAEKNEEKTTETEKEETHAVRKEPDVDSCKDSVKDSSPCSLVSLAVTDSKSERDRGTEPEYTEPMETDGDSMEAKAPEAAEAPTGTEKKPAPPKGTSSSPGSSSPCPAPSSSTVPELDQEVKEEEEEKEVKEVKEEKDCIQDVKIGPTKEKKMEVDSVKVEMKKEKPEVAGSSKPSRPSSTPPSDTGVKERSSTSGLKRTLSEGDEKDGQKVERDGKRPKVEGVELEAQLELKITAKAGSRIKLEKVVQQLVEERLRVLQLTVFDQNLQELKDRVEKIDCATKHQTTLTTLQTKIARLAKKFGEANQASENKKKQEALAAAVAAATAKSAATTNTPPSQRPVRTSMEVKQIPTTLASTIATASPAQPIVTSTATTTAMVQQAPILQLITSASNVASTLGAGITTQSPTGTLLLKTAPQGPPLLIQVPLSMTNGQPGTLVNIPVSTFSAANSLNKAKTTTPTATFILKPGPSCTTAVASTSVTATVSALQASTAHMSPAQISLARAVYQGGAGGINTPSAGVSVTTARTPAQTVSVAGAMSSASSPATSGPAATGSTAPGPPQGTSMTSKTDNQVTGSTPTKTAVPGARPKGSVIDLTDDDDDVQVTGVKNAVAAPPSANQRPPPLISISNNAAARSSPQINQSSVSKPQLTVHHRPPQDSPVKSRTVTTTPSTRPATVALPPLPVAPAPPGRLPPEAAQTSLPQQPQLKLVPSQTGIVLSWCVSEPDRTCATVDSYHLYAFHQDNSSASAAQQYWKKIGEVKALPLPMACTLTQFQSGSTYHFAVRAKDIYGRFGSFCEPQCTNVINSGSG